MSQGPGTTRRLAVEADAPAGNASASRRATTLTAVSPRARTRAGAWPGPPPRKAARRTPARAAVGAPAQEHAGASPAEEPLDELAPAQRWAPLHAQADLVARRVPGQMRRPGGNDDDLARTGLALDTADPEGGPPGDHLVALLHLR